MRWPIRSGRRTCTRPGDRCRASRPAAGFEEEHSHATGHLLLPSDPDLLVAAEQIVLVDDELSTGRTALNTIRGLLAAGARCRRFVIATLIDVRSDPAGFDVAGGRTWT